MAERRAGRMPRWGPCPRARRTIRDAEESVQSPDRLVTLADGIFAIAMTLLVLNISLPSGLDHEHFRASLHEAWSRLARPISDRFARGMIADCGATIAIAVVAVLVAVTVSAGAGLFAWLAAFSAGMASRRLRKES